ncbi:lutropin-choriogonadotropic hormone receptor [Prorops nasuta]|uniref:lutropin-choriogonadotropic hormone receptor n=1 Tax=Prorops nasuta TaxID=863751 RepID=UPI0034CF3618
MRITTHHNWIIIMATFLSWLTFGHCDHFDEHATSKAACTIIGNDSPRLLCRGAELSSIASYLQTDLFPFLKNLTKFDLSDNDIDRIPLRVFQPFVQLKALLLRRDKLRTIEGDASKNLPNLQILELDENYLTDVPATMINLTNLKHLSLSNNRIEEIRENDFARSYNLESIDLRGNPVKRIHHRAFRNLGKLRKLILSDTKELEIFPNFDGAGALELLRLDRARLKDVPSTFCYHCPRLKSLDLKSNLLPEIPDLANCLDLRVLDLTGNRISSLTGAPFKNLRSLHDLLLSHNRLRTIPRDSFHGLSELQVLDLESNNIDYVHPEAFREMKRLRDLNLGNNLFADLPIEGLSSLLHLKTFNNPALKDFPLPELFPRIQTMVLSYAYHCCLFLHKDLADRAITVPAVRETVIFPDSNAFDMTVWNSSFANTWPRPNKTEESPTLLTNRSWINYGTTYEENYGSYLEENYGESYDEQRNYLHPRESPPTARVQCLPQPGPFLPCQDLFDWWTLRCGVWIVFLLAILGNGTVVFVLVFSRSKMDVPRFLVCNLAAADFFMGIYLGLLAVVDASTLGEFRMYAIPWQMSVGCQLAGFLGVLSSELSVYTLAVITLERNYAITHAMHLNKRLSLKHASYVMAVGWLFALVMAILPLVGVSDYRKFAICLPFETNGTASLSYVVFLMLINGIAFLILMGCYLKMYCAIRGSQAWNSNDSRIAKRMALLVFTDFLCWSPIAFFSLTAVFGLRLVSLEQAKVFAVFVLPLNSCCNPFLYAILTKQFKKDCVLICKAIEESRVTRGIGRCRHSSNFSNRHTPADTNSLVDRPSRGENHRAENQVTYCTCQTPGTRSTNSARVRVRGRPLGLSTATAAEDEEELEDRCPGDHRLSCSWLLRYFCHCVRDQRSHDPRRSDLYAYQIAEIQQKQHKRASSVSSSENFSSSRSDSWRQTHHCGIPLRLLDPKRKSSSWLIARKPSEDSNLSSSRNDSSASATTASTSTWRISRSSTSIEANRNTPRPARSKPRLTRQLAVQEPEPPNSPTNRLAVRLLATIPSAAEASEQQDDDVPATSS